MLGVEARRPLNELGHRLRAGLEALGARPAGLVVAVVVGIGIGVLAGALISPSGGSDGSRRHPLIPAEQAAPQAAVDHLRALRARDYGKAWRLLSSRRRMQDVREFGGYPGWARYERSAFRGVDASGVSARISHVGALDAQVVVGGLRDANGCAFSFIARIHREGDRWLYDSATPQGRAQVRPRGPNKPGIPCAG